MSFSISGEVAFIMSCCYVQQEYIRGVSAWNFNLEDLRNQAALVYHLLTDHLLIVKS